MPVSRKKTVTVAQLLRKTETKVGLAILVVCILGVGVLAVRVMTPAMRQLAGRVNQRDAQATVLLSPVPTDLTSAPMTQLTASPSARPVAEVNNQKLKAVTKLSFTSSTTYITVRVRQDDTFWSIAKRVCGNGKLATKLQRQAGYTRKWIQPGDVLRVSCN